MDHKNESSSIANLLHETRMFAPSQEFSAQAHIGNFQLYEEMYRLSISKSDIFWLEQTEILDWIKKPTLSCRYVWDVDNEEIYHTWFEDGELNVAYNCLDRHLSSEKKSKTAIIWQGDNDSEYKILTFEELHTAVCRFANSLKSRGITKGDRICLYMPMIPELAIAMLACARIGAIHSIVFGGFSAESLIHRINDSSCKLLITADYGMRGGKKIELKKTVDEALIHTPSIKSVIVVKRMANGVDPNEKCPMSPERDYWYHEEIADQSPASNPEPMNAEDPLFILYTSGTTGSPKGVVHTQAGYLLYAALTHRYVFDIQETDVYWCTADIGWITGHSYCIYGPLANGCTTLLFEGTPTHPDASRFWKVVEKFKVSVFYTAPTVIRLLISQGKEYPQKYDLSSIRLLGTVGEPINPEAWIWYHETIGKGKAPIVDTWWQTETGGILIAPLPGSHTLKPGSATRPFFGIDPVIVKEDGSECDPNEGGYLCIRRPWPGIMRTTWGDHKRFIKTYFSSFKNFYFTGDGCRKDEDGDYWLLGRVDDIVNISGHRIGTAEVESALVSHKAVAEAAVVPMPHPIKGQGLYAFVTLIGEAARNASLKNELMQHISKEIGPIAIPEKIQFTKGLPKTRSGKIMRRILRKIAEKDYHNIGDISTLADPKVVEDLMTSE